MESEGWRIGRALMNPVENKVSFRREAHAYSGRNLGDGQSFGARGGKTKLLLWLLPRNPPERTVFLVSIFQVK